MLKTANIEGKSCWAKLETLENIKKYAVLKSINGENVQKRAKDIIEKYVMTICKNMLKISQKGMFHVKQSQK